MENSHNSLHVIVDTFSFEWFKLTIICLGFMLAFLFIPKFLSKKSKIQVGNLIGGLLLTISILIHPYLLYLGRWEAATSLPFHMCTISGYLCAWALISRNQLAYEFGVFWGIGGGIHSILTPEFLHGADFLLITEYYILHGGIILAPIYMTYHYKMRVRKHSWIKIFLISQLIIPVIGGTNYLLNSNYMYINEKPEADNPFLIGDWPIYVIFIDLFMLIHFLILYLIFKSWKKQSLLQSSEGQHPNLSV